MNGLTWIDIVLRIFPEGLIIILAGYAVSKKSVIIKLLLLSSIIFALMTFLIKMMPVSAAVTTILSAITAVILLVFINKIKVIHSIFSTITCLLLALLLDGLNIFVVDQLLHIDTSEIFHNANPLLKSIYGLPSLLLFAAIVIVFYFCNIKREAKKNVISK